MLSRDDEVQGFFLRHPFTGTAIALSDLEEMCRAYEQWEPRDSMYRVSTFLARAWWADPTRLVDALSVLQLVWNGAFYRYGGFNKQALEDCLRQNYGLLGAFRDREILSCTEADEPDIKRIFQSLLDALRNTANGKRSAVSAGKALHLLAPNFFPLWDRYIAYAYRCPYNEKPSAAYLAFTQRIRPFAIQISNELATEESPRKLWLSEKPLLKRIDEYNYMKYTVPELGWRNARVQP